MYGYSYQYGRIIGKGGGSAFVGLLDDYPTAAAAYSLRKLRNAYSGDAIRVRRASDNAESNIGFVDNELDTATLTTFASGTNAFITNFYDQSGNGVDLFRSVAVGQPQIVASGVIITDSGKPTLSFPNGNSLLHTSGLAELLIPDEWTMSFVTKADAAQTYSFTLGDAVGDNQDGILIFGSLFRTKIDNVNKDVYGSGDNRTKTRLWTSIRNSSNTITINRDGTSYGSVSSAVGSFDFVQIGSSIEVNQPDFVSELIIWKSDQTSNANGIETNINDFYGIY
jgi:hypothetical protein